MSHVHDLHWLKSSFSDEGGNNCVEIATHEDGGIALRESDSPAAIVSTNQAALRALVLGVKAGEVGPPRA